MSDINKGYNPLSICNTMGGDGGVVHVIGNSHMLVSGGNLGTVVPSALSIDMRNYLGWQNTPDTQPIQLGSTAEDGKRAILVRTDLLKKQCKTPPLIGIEILEGDASTGSLIGTGDLADPNNPSRGSLHRLFFSNAPQHLSGFASRVKRGTPDKPADDVDILMHDWYPMCQGTGTLPGEKEVSEIELRIDLARALMGNFSKPSLIWKFGFPSNSMCNKTFFLDYLFNQTALMVDSGIIGIIYSDWMTRDGLPYGPPTKSYIEPDGAMVPSTVTLNTGMTDARTTKRGDPTYLTTPLDDPGVGRGSLFCAMQAFSKRVIGYTSLTYGQKIYAENKTCFCDPCTSYDYITGVCDREALIAQNNDPNLPQLYCNDGHTCTMPVDEQSRSPIPYSQYKCESRCLNETACKLCNSSTYLSSASFCRISTPNSPASGYSLPYNQINDYNWEFLAGLSPQEKCCLQSTGEGLYGTEYTYTTMTGTKQQSEFLQFPKRGEADIDCGRVPDTSVLEFCGVRVPISQKEIACMKINNPVNPINIQQIETGYSYD